MRGGAGPEVCEQSASVSIGALEVSGFGSMGHDALGGGNQIGIELQRLAMRRKRLLARRLPAAPPGSVAVVTAAKRVPRRRERGLQRHGPLEHLDRSLGRPRLLRKCETAQIQLIRLIVGGHRSRRRDGARPECGQQAVPHTLGETFTHRQQIAGGRRDARSPDHALLRHVLGFDRETQLLVFLQIVTAGHDVIHAARTGAREWIAVIHIAEWTHSDTLRFGEQRRHFIRQGQAEIAQRLIAARILESQHGHARETWRRCTSPPRPRQTHQRHAKKRQPDCEKPVPAHHRTSCRRSRRIVR